MAITYLSYAGTSTYEPYTFTYENSVEFRDSSGGVTVNVTEGTYTVTQTLTGYDDNASSEFTYTQIDFDDSASTTTSSSDTFPNLTTYDFDVSYGSVISSSGFLTAVKPFSQTVSDFFPTLITSSSGTETFYTTSLTNREVVSLITYSTSTRAYIETVFSNGSHVTSAVTATDLLPVYTSSTISYLSNSTTETSVNLPAVYHTVVIADTEHGEFLIIPTREGNGLLSDLVTTATATTFFYSIQEASSGHPDHYSFEVSDVGGANSVTTNFGLLGPVDYTTRVVTGYIDAAGSSTATLLLPASWNGVPIGIRVANGMAFQAGSFLSDSRLMAYPLTTNFTASSNFLLGSFTESHISSVSAAVGVRMPLPASTTFSSSTNAVTVEPVDSSFLATLDNSAGSFTSALSISDTSNFQTTTTVETVAGGDPYFQTYTVMKNPMLFSESRHAIQTWDTESSGSSWILSENDSSVTQDGRLSAFLPNLAAVAYSYQVAPYNANIFNPNVIENMNQELFFGNNFIFHNTPFFPGAFWPRFLVSKA
jgi:hypothetical protein